MQMEKWNIHAVPFTRRFQVSDYGIHLKVKHLFLSLCLI